MRAEDINSIESEAGIIASLIHNPEFSFHSEFLLPSHFTDSCNRLVYSAICDLAQKGISNVDPYNIIEDLNSREETRGLVGELTIDKLNELVEMSDVLARPSIEEYKLLVKNVMDSALRRDTYQKLKECQSLCLDTRETNIQQKIYEIVDGVMTSYSRIDEIPTYDKVVDKLWDEIETRQAVGYAGFPFKFPTLNQYVTIEKGELVIFGAQQKMGKSIMLLNCAVDLMRQGKSVLYIDSELSSRMFTGRLLSHISGVEYKRVTSGNYSEEEKNRIMSAKAWMKNQRFTHLYMPFFKEDAIYTAVRKISHVYPIDVLIIDYFKSTGDEIGAFETYAAMGRIVDCIKNKIAGDLNIAALGAAQATVNNKLADSAKIARNASTIIMLMDKTDDEIEADGYECGNKKLVVTVNRNGMQMSSGEYIDLLFDGNHISYTEAKQHTPKNPY